MPDFRWPKRFPMIVYGLLLVLFPLALLEIYLVQQWAPMPELQLLTSDPSIIYKVISGCGAEAAGVRAGDKILQMNGRPFNPEHLSMQVRNMKVGQLLDLELDRNGSHFLIRVPMVPVGQVTHKRFILVSSLAFILWATSSLLIWRSFLPLELRLLFLLGQSIALGLLFPYIDVINWISSSSWSVGLSGLGALFSVLLLFHFHISFPVILGTRIQRRIILSIFYGAGMVLAAVWITHNYSLYFPHSSALWLAMYSITVGAIALGVQVYVYMRRANPDGRRRLRLIMVAELIAGLIPGLFYLIPSAMLGYPLIPEWMVVICILVAPLAYIVATMQNNLFEIDRILNHSVVFAILSIVILVFCVAPISLIYWFLGDWPGHLIIVTGLLLLAAAFFDPIRKSVQRLVDRLFYGGWYDYPGVVEEISDALARSLEWDQLVEILTHQMPMKMRLRGAVLQVNGQATPALEPSLHPQKSFPLIFEKQTSGLWVIGPRRDGEDFTSEDLRIFNTLAHQAAIAVSNMLLVKRIRDQLREIEANREVLMQIDRQLFTTREEERARLSRDLHDGPVQALISLNMQLGMVSSSITGGDPVQSMREEIKNIVYDLRTMCADLRPPMLDTLGLAAALRDLAQDWSAQCGIPISFEQSPDVDVQPLPGEVAVNLYRVAQEALSNISRHAEASQVHLWIDANPVEDLFCMVIWDNGKGFHYDPAHRLVADGHMGLVNMQERVALFGGQWKVETSPGRGTKISATWQAPKPVMAI